MKLHDLVSDPTKLKTHGKYISIENAYKRLRDGDQDSRLIDVVAKDPKYAYHYALNVIKDRFPEGEPAIAKNSQYAYHYALNVIKDRFPEGEPAIAKTSEYANMYAHDILNINNKDIK